MSFFFFPFLHSVHIQLHLFTSAVINRSRISLLAPLVILLVQLSGQSDVGNDNDVEGARGVLGLLGEVAAGVVLVFALTFAFPGSAGDGYGGFGGGLGGRAACGFC